MQDNWVDFKAIKAAVTMEMILGRYGSTGYGRKKMNYGGAARSTRAKGRAPFTSVLPRTCSTAFHARHGATSWTSLLQLRSARCGMQD